jgi:hypothetical protein
MSHNEKANADTIGRQDITTAISDSELKTATKVQLPMELVIRYQTKNLMSEGTDAKLAISCLDQETEHC